METVYGSGKYVVNKYVVNRSIFLDMYEEVYEEMYEEMNKAKLD